MVEKAILKVLIVEDNDIARQSIVEILRQEGIKNIHEASKSIEAIRMFEKYIPDILLIDIDLEQPGSDGIDLANILTAIKRVPFIYLSNHITKRDDNPFWNKAILSSHYGYIPKSAAALPNAAWHYIELAVEAFQREEGLLSTSRSFTEFLHHQLFIRSHTGNPFKRVLAGEILFMKTKADGINQNGKKIEHRTIIYLDIENKVSTDEEKILETGLSLAELQLGFNHPGLQRINRDCVVNVMCVAGYDADSRTVYFENGESVMASKEGHLILKKLVVANRYKVR